MHHNDEIYVYSKKHITVHIQPYGYKYEFLTEENRSVLEVKTMVDNHHQQQQANAVPLDLVNQDYVFRRQVCDETSSVCCFFI